LEHQPRELLGHEEGRLVLIRRSQRGFTIVELMVGVAIVALLIMMSVPSMSDYLQSSKLATAATSYQAGLQLARSEAIRLNLPVQFVLTDTQVTAGIETAAAPSANGRNWVVRYTDPATAAFVLVEAKSVSEGGAQRSGGTPSLLVTGAPVAPAAAFNGSVTFDGLGATNAGGAIQLDLQNPAGGACAPAGPMRCPRLRVSSGGQVHRCDPAANVGDSRAC
jgi:type IV fimbrial biogenesis protein FimT